MKRLVAAILPILLTAASAQVLPDGTYITAPYGPGGSWNLYQARSTPMTWTEAQSLAESLTDPLGGSGKKGHLVCVGSAAENMFVFETVLGQHIWLGLTDNPKWGGKEAGADRTGGWRWVNGEPVTFSNWRGTEPNEYETTGEDGVVITLCGRWEDWPIGSQGQTPVRHSFMIEWETNSPQPVPGVVSVGRILPDHWAADTLVAEKSQGDGPWRVFNATGISGGSIESVVAEINEGLRHAVGGGRLPEVYRIPRLNYRNLWNEITAGGWTWIADRAQFPLTSSGCGSLHVATVHLDEPATWSINIHADDYFAVRFPGLKWKSVTGVGGLDPLDPETIYHDCATGDGHAIGVIELPAGDSRIEVLRGNRLNDTMIQLLAAPGTITLDGGTDQWRFPGHKAAKDSLAWPGMDGAGWTVKRVDRTATDPPLSKLMDGLVLLQGDGGTTADGVAKINFIDSGASGDVLFPDPKEFPGDSPGNQDRFAVRATGNLVIPRDGIYHIGILAEERCALRIKGGKWLRFIRDSSYVGKLEGDTIYGELPPLHGTNEQLVAEIELKKGTYETEALYTHLLGPSVFSIFGGPAGYPPRLLTKDGAGIEPDIAGLPLK